MVILSNRKIQITNMFMDKLLVFGFTFLGYATLSAQIQNEPQRVFNVLLGETSLADYAREHNLKKISYYRGDEFSSSNTFDKRGNSILYVTTENKAVKRSESKWDDQNRIVETKIYTPEGTFSSGNYYRYLNGAVLRYGIEDSLLQSKSYDLEPENISVWMSYNKEGKIKSRWITVKDALGNYLIENRFEEDRLRTQFRFEYVDGKKYNTRITYNDNGTKISESRWLRWEKSKDRKVFFSEKSKNIFRIDSLNKQGKVFRMIVYDNDNKLYKEEFIEYNNNGQKAKVLKNFYLRPKTELYTYIYDEEGKLEVVTKDINGETEVFKYLYETH